MLHALELFLKFTTSTENYVQKCNWYPREHLRREALQQ